MADNEPEASAVAEVQAEAVAVVSSETVTAARRLVESFGIAIVTSTGLYLVGSVYTDAYYGRMSIEVNALDLPPTFIAVQSMHVLQSLLGYPSTLLIFWGISRLFSSRMLWLRSAYGRARRRYERTVLLITNLVVVTPLVIDAVRALNREVIPGNSAVSEVSTLLGNVVLVLVIYVTWLSLGPRVLIFSELRQRKILPIALLVLAYLLSALISTADTGSRAAEVFLLGSSDTSMGVEFTMRQGRNERVSDADLLLVTARNSNYFVVERQPYPPSGRPISYIVPFDAVEFARVQRLNEANLELTDLIQAELEAMGVATPVAP